jgi:hypothetical protein
VALSPESLDDQIGVADAPPLGTINSLVSIELMLDPELEPYYKATGWWKNEVSQVMQPWHAPHAQRYI